MRVKTIEMVKTDGEGAFHYYVCLSAHRELDDLVNMPLEMLSRNLKTDGGTGFLVVFQLVSRGFCYKGGNGKC